MTLAPWLRRTVIAVAALVAAVAMLAGGTLVFLHTDAGEKWTARTTELLVPGLALDGYRLAWPFRMRADTVRLADGAGPWLEATGVEMVWHPLRLWRRHLDIDRLMADGVRVLRRPAAEPDAGNGWAPPAGTLRLGELRAPIRLEAPVLGQPMDLELTGTFMMRRGGGDVQVALRDRNGGFVRLDGVAGLDYLDLRWSLRLTDLGAVRGLAGIRLAGAATGSGNVVGRLPNPSISGRLGIERGAAGALEWESLSVTTQIVPSAPLWSVAAQAELRRPSLNGQKLPADAANLALIGDVAPELGRVRLGYARLAGGPVVADVSGMVEQWGRHAVLRLHGRADLAAWPGMAGRADARGLIAGDLTHGHLDARLAVTAARAKTGTELLDRALGQSPRAALAAHLRGDRLMLSASRLDGAHATLSALGTLSPRTHLWLHLTAPQLSALTQGVNGSGQAWGHLGGDRISGVAQLSGLQATGGPSLSGDVAFDLDTLAHPRGPLSAHALVGDVPVQASARLDTTRGAELRDLLVSSGESRLAGELAFRGGIGGRLAATIPDLRRWERLAARPLAGRLEATATLSPARGQSAQIALRGQQVAVAGLTLPTLNADIDASGLTGAPLGTARLEAEAEAGGQRIEGIRLRASGRPGRVVLEETDARLGTVPLRLVRPAVVQWSEDAISLSPALLSLGGGRVELAGRAGAQRLDARARLEGVPLTLVRLAAPVDAVGTVSGSIAATGTPSAPLVRFALDGRDIGVAAAARAGLGRMAAHLAGSWRDGRAQAEANLRDGERIRLDAGGSLPLPGDGPLSIRFALRGDAGRIAEALPLAGHVIAGRIEAGGRVGGTMASPSVTGRATLSNGRYENLDAGTVVAALAATADIDGDRARISAQGGDGAQGRVRLEGDGGLDGRYRADVTFDRFTALRRDDVEAAVSGTLRLAGAGDQGTVSGRLAVPRAEVDVGRIRGGGPVALDVVEINGPPAAKPAQRTASAQAPMTLALAVQVAVEHAFVRGHGLDSEWQGDLDVAGTLSQPSLTGRLAAARGQFDFLGKPFKLSPDSTVTFEGGDRIDPSLDVTADASASDVTARVEITGTAREPQFAFTSDPPLPQDEVLARVLFGREAGKLSTFQQVQLAQMAAGGLTGGGEGFDPIGAVRGFLGLDVLGVGSSDDKAGAANAGPTLSAGKYIGPDTFVRVEQGTAGLGKVTVEQEVGRGFSLESSLGEQSGGGVGLNWRMNY